MNRNKFYNIFLNFSSLAPGHDCELKYGDEVNRIFGLHLKKAFYFLSLGSFSVQTLHVAWLLGPLIFKQETFKICLQK